MNWIRINGNLIQASGRGFTFSVRELSSDKYLVTKESFTNGNDEKTVKTQTEAIALAETWDASR